MSPTIYCNVYSCPENKDEQCHSPYITVFQTDYDAISVHCPFALKNEINPEVPLNQFKEADLLTLTLED